MLNGACYYLDMTPKGREKPCIRVGRPEPISHEDATM